MHTVFKEWLAGFSNTCTRSMLLYLSCRSTSSDDPDVLQPARKHILTFSRFHHLVSFWPPFRAVMDYESLITQIIIKPSVKSKSKYVCIFLSVTKNNRSSINWSVTKNNRSSINWSVTKNINDSFSWSVTQKNKSFRQTKNVSGDSSNYLVS